MTLEFRAETIEWRGPAPFVFVRVPEALSVDTKAIAALVTYGWGAIPLVAKIGSTEYPTSLFPKDGRYLVPVKTQVQKAENVKVGDIVDVVLKINVGSG